MKINLDSICNIFRKYLREKYTSGEANEHKYFNEFAFLFRHLGDKLVEKDEDPIFDLNDSNGVNYLTIDLSKITDEDLKDYLDKKTLSSLLVIRSAYKSLKDCCSSHYRKDAPIFIEISDFCDRVLKITKEQISEIKQEEEKESEVKKGKEVSNKFEYLDDRDVIKLFDYFENHSDNNSPDLIKRFQIKRDYILFKLFLYLGLMPNEVINLKVSNIKNEESCIIEKDNGETRTLLFPSEFKKGLRCYLDLREKYLGSSANECDNFIINCYKQGITRQYVNRIINMYCYEVLNRKVNPTILKETVRRGLYRNGWPIEECAYYLGTEIETEKNNWTKYFKKIFPNPISYRDKSLDKRHEKHNSREEKLIISLIDENIRDQGRRKENGTAPSTDDNDGDDPR